MAHKHVVAPPMGRRWEQEGESTGGAQVWGKLLDHSERSGNDRGRSSTSADGTRMAVIVAIYSGDRENKMEVGVGRSTGNPT